MWTSLPWAGTPETPAIGGSLTPVSRDVTRYVSFEKCLAEFVHA